MAWKALNGMNVVWRSSLSRDLKIRFFRATVESILLYGSECWSLSSSSRKSLDGAYTRMLRTILNINWRDHVPNVTLYGDLPRLTDRIAWRRLGIAGHCYRHRELPASQLVLWEPTHGRRKPGRPPTTFLNILQDDIGATTSAELPACMKERKDWNLRREARLRPPWWWWWWWWGLYLFKRLFCLAYFRGSLFSEGLIIGRKFAFQNGLSLAIKQLALTVHGFIFGKAYYRKDFCVWDLGGLFLGGLIIFFFFGVGGGAYHRNFTVFWISLAVKWNTSIYSMLCMIDKKLGNISIWSFDLISRESTKR